MNILDNIFKPGDKVQFLDKKMQTSFEIINSPKKFLIISAVENYKVSVKFYNGITFHFSKFIPFKEEINKFEDFYDEYEN
ncbi:MAG: hypothetical protein ABIP51_15180 [Bacteroidia bacterium]